MTDHIVVNADGEPTKPGASIFDVKRETPPWQPPTDSECAVMQERVGDAYAAWSDKQAADPPPPRASTQYGEGGEYPPFSDLLDAEPEQHDDLRREVLRVAQPDTGGA